MTKRRRRGEGGTRRRADGRWEWSLSLGLKPDGTPDRKWGYAKTETQVLAKLRQARATLDAGRPLLDERARLGSFLDTWLEEVIRPDRTYDTWRGYRNNVEGHIKPALGRIPLARLAPVDVVHMLDDLRERGLAPRTIQYTHATLRSALTTAERWELVHRNVAKRVAAPTVHRPKIVPLDPAEAKRFLAVAQKHRLGALFTVAIALGLRPEEAMGLSWDSVTLDGPVPNLRVAQVLKREHGKPVLRSFPKTATSRRTIPLPDICVRSLRAHSRQQKVEHLACEAWQEWGLVFTSRIGTPLEHRGLTRVFDSLLARAGLPHRRLYDLRHTAASILLAQRVEPRTLMDILGHSTIRHTMDIYAHVMEPAKQDAARAMDRALSIRGQFRGQTGS